jgi:hypothetical protein
MEPFYCDTASCVVTNYQLTTVNTGIVAPVGVTGPTLNAVTGLLEISVSDTSILASYQLYVYAELQNYANINVFSNRITISVVCGNELIVAS